MRNPTEMFSRNTLIYCSMLLMIAALLLSRATLSVSLGIFFLLTMVHSNFSAQLKSFVTNKFLLLFSFLFWIPFVSGLWSEDVQQWLNVSLIKLPFLLLPIAFAGNWQLKEHQWKTLAFFFIIVVLVGCGLSLVGYVSNKEVVHESYLKAGLIQTPLDNDHVRFSWMVAVAVMLCVFLVQRSTAGVERIFLAFAAVLMAIYLHVLAARMGLAVFYIFFTGWLFYHFFKIRSGLKYFILTGLLVLPLAGYFLFPTLQNRIKYFRYDISQVQHGHYVPGTNDGARFYSIKAGWDLLTKHPMGVGAGDVMNKVQSWFQDHQPQVIPADRFPPLNEWLMYGNFAGWIGLLIFTVVIFYPFLKKSRYPFFWITLNAVIVFSHLFDMGLEVQYGVFLYSFILLWWYKWFKSA